MSRDAYFSFGEEEPDGPTVAVAADPFPSTPGGAAIGDPLLGGHPGTQERPLDAPTGRGGSPGRRHRFLTPARLAAFVAVTVAAILLGRALAGAFGGGAGDPRGAVQSRGIAERAGARALAPARPGIAGGGETRPRRHAAEQERVQRRRSQTRRRARRHREGRQVEQRNLSARTARPAPEVPTSQPTETEAPPPAQPTEAEAPPSAQPIETPATPAVPPVYSPPSPNEPAPEAEPAPSGPPRIQNGAHSSEFGL